MPSTLNQVKSVIADKKNVETKDISDGSELNSLGLDSLSVVELMMSIEDTFNIEIEDDEAAKVKTVGDLAELVDKSKDN